MRVGKGMCSDNKKMVKKINVIIASNLDENLNNHFSVTFRFFLFFVSFISIETISGCLYRFSLHFASTLTTTRHLSRKSTLTTLVWKYFEVVSYQSIIKIQFRISAFHSCTTQMLKALNHIV